MVGLSIGCDYGDHHPLDRHHVGIAHDMCDKHALGRTGGVDFEHRTSHQDVLRNRYCVREGLDGYDLSGVLCQS